MMQPVPRVEIMKIKGLLVLIITSWYYPWNSTKCNYVYPVAAFCDLLTKSLRMPDKKDEAGQLVYACLYTSGRAYVLLLLASSFWHCSRARR